MDVGVDVAVHHKGRLEGVDVSRIAFNVFVYFDDKSKSDDDYSTVADWLGYMREKYPGYRSVRQARRR